MESVRLWSRCACGGGVAHGVGAPVGAALPVGAMCPWGAAAGSKRGGGKWVLYALNDGC